MQVLHRPSEPAAVIGQVPRHVRIVLTEFRLQQSNPRPNVVKLTI
jgi:hypothetical protein